MKIFARLPKNIQQESKWGEILWRTCRYLVWKVWSI